MSRVKFNQWPGYKSFADQLTHPLTNESEIAALIGDMTIDELVGTSEVLISELSGIDASIVSLGELRVRVNSLLRRLENKLNG